MRLTKASLPRIFPDIINKHGKCGDGHPDGNEPEDRDLFGKHKKDDFIDQQDDAEDQAGLVKLVLVIFLIHVRTPAAGKEPAQRVPVSGGKKEDDDNQKCQNDDVKRT